MPFVFLLSNDCQLLGALAAIITHPFDTVKSIRQVQLGSNKQKERHERTIRILQRMLKEQGVQSWYKGK